MEYYALFEPATEGGFVITFPDFGWGVSQGDSEEDARGMAEALLETLAQEHIRRGEELPRARRLRGGSYRPIRMSAAAGMKAELYNAFQASGIKKAEFARRLGIPKTNVDRLFQFKHHTRLEQMEAAFAALGKQLDVVVVDSAA